MRNIIYRAFAAIITYDVVCLNALYKKPRHRCCSHKTYTRTSCERPKAKVIITKTNSDVSDADIITRTSDVVKRWSSQTMLDDIHAHHHDKHGDIWPEGLAIICREFIVTFQSMMCR